MNVFATVGSGRPTSKVERRGDLPPSALRARWAGFVKLFVRQRLDRTLAFLVGLRLPKPYVQAVVPVQDDVSAVELGEFAVT